MAINLGDRSVRRDERARRWVLRELDRAAQKRRAAGAEYERAPPISIDRKGDGRCSKTGRE